MKHSSEYKPRVVPVMGAGDWNEIDRVQSIDKTGTINTIRVEEVGNPDVVGQIKQPPTIAYRMTQNEYGSLDFYKKLANVNTGNIIVPNDFKSSAFDICSYLFEDSTFEGTIWIPKLRVAGFSITIGDPNSLIERSFDFVGEDWITWQGTNKYLIYKSDTVESGEAGNFDITVSDPSAVEDPKVSGTYILRVVRIRSSVATELEAGAGTDQYSYSAPTLTVNDCEVGDIVKYWYTASSYIGGETPFVPNTSDLPGIHANSASIYLASGNYVYRLQSVTIDNRFDREDLFEIGNSEIVQRGIRNKTVTITLGRILETFTIEEILAGEVTGFGKLDIREFGTDLELKVKLFSDKTKATFKIGYFANKLTPSEIRGGAGVDTHVEAGDTLTGEYLSICDDETTFDALS